MHGTKEDLRKSSNSWLDLCNNGDYSIPPTGLEFHNTQLMPNPVCQQSSAINVLPISTQAPQPLQNSREQHAINRSKHKEMDFSNNQSSLIGGVPHNKPPVIGAQEKMGRAQKRPNYSGNVTSSTHYYTGPHYSQLAAGNYNRNCRYYNYQQQHHT